METKGQDHKDVEAKVELVQELHVLSQASLVEHRVAKVTRVMCLWSMKLPVVLPVISLVLEVFQL